jgi:hypothetical protein
MKVYSEEYEIIEILIGKSVFTAYISDEEVASPEITYCAFQTDANSQKNL